MISDYIKLASKENMYPSVRKTILLHQKLGDALKVVLFLLSYFYQIYVCWNFQCLSD